MRKRSILVAGAVVGMLAFGAVIATAGPGDVKKFDSKVTMAFDPGASNDPYAVFKDASFKGKVTSDRGFCIKNRTVVLREIGVGRIGQDTSTKQGEYSIAHDLGTDRGQYRAKAKQKIKEKKNGTRVVCKGATSPIVSAP